MRTMTHARSATTIQAACCLLLAAVVAELFAGVANAKEAAPVALVTSVSGTVEPSLVVRQEIVPGTRVIVAAGSRVSLLHYAACMVVTVTGGVVTVTDSGVEANPDALVNTTTGPCPRVHRLTVAGPGPLSGAMVMRAFPARLQLSPDVDLTLTGTLAPDAISADILNRERKAVYTGIPVHDGLVRLSSALSVGESYVLALTLAGRTEPLELSFVVSSPTSKGPSILELE
jgi:hypothetical protein